MKLVMHFKTWLHSKRDDAKVRLFGNLNPIIADVASGLADNADSMFDQHRVKRIFMRKYGTDCYPAIHFNCSVWRNSRRTLGCIQHHLPKQTIFASEH